jgi:hypothetical protein
LTVMWNTVCAVWVPLLRLLLSPLDPMIEYFCVMLRCVVLGTGCQELVQCRDISLETRCWSAALAAG